MFLKEEDVLEVQGLDAWMHMQFQWLPGLHLLLFHQGRGRSGCN